MTTFAARGVEPRNEEYGIELAAVTTLPTTVVERARYTWREF
jgi:hypothetical protein